LISLTNSGACRLQQNRKKNMKEQLMNPSNIKKFPVPLLARRLALRSNMRTRLLGIACYVLVTMCGFSQSTNCVPPPANMVLWLPFDETSGNFSANLEAPADYGTQFGGPTVVFGSYVDNSLSFDGTTNQYVSVPDYSAIDFGTNDFTIDAWVNRSTNGPNSLPSIIVDKRDINTAAGYSLALSYGKLVLALANGINYEDPNPLVPPDGLWHFVAVSVSQSTFSVLFFIDGNIYSTGLGAPSADVSNTNSFWVGGSQYGDLTGSDRHWTGDIDEVEVYHRALATNELNLIYGAGTNGKCKPGCVPPPANMVLWLPFDETSGTISANLETTSAYYGTQIGGPTPVLGQFVDNSLGFNSTNGPTEYVSVPDYPAIEIDSGDLTIDAWVNLSTNASISPPSVIVDKRDTNYVGYSLAVDYNNLIFQMSGSNFRDTIGAVPPDGRWHFVAVTVSRTSSLAGQFYVDGGPTGTFTPLTGSLYNTHPFWVGAGELAGNQPWLGDIDEVEVFTNALTSTEIQAIYNAGTAGKCKPPCPNTNCCAGCVAPFPDSYTVTVYPGSNMLGDWLCQGTNNTVADILVNLPSVTTLYLWDSGTQSWGSPDVFNGAWSNPNLTLSAGEPFLLVNDSGVTVTTTIYGCIPTNCPGGSPPCTPSINAEEVVCGVGTTALTYANLFSCPPLCGTEFMTLNSPNGTFTTDVFINGVWMPQAPTLPVGLSAFVEVNPMLCATNVVPIINNQPVSFTNFYSGNGNLVVQGYSSTPLTYQWYQGGSVLPGQTTSVISFTSLTLANAGTYTVVLNNAFGSVTSAPATITVVPAPQYVDTAYAVPYSGPANTAELSNFLATSTASAITNLDEATKTSLLNYQIFTDGIPRGMSGTDQNIQNLAQTSAQAVFSAIFGTPVTVRSNSIDQYIPLDTLIAMGGDAVMSCCLNCRPPSEGEGVCCVVDSGECEDDIAVVGTNVYRVDVPFPTAFAGSNQTIVAGQTVSLGQTPAAGYAYSWSPADGLSSTNEANPTASPKVTTTYTFTVAARPEISVISQVTITVNANESLVYQGLTNTSLGNATLAASNGTLIVSNLGSSGQDGISIAIPTNLSGLDVNWQPLDPSNTLPVGAYIQEDIIGTAGAITNGLLGTVTTTKLCAACGTNYGSNYVISADFSPIGASHYTVQAYLQGVLVAKATNQTGPALAYCDIWDDSGCTPPPPVPGGGWDWETNLTGGSLPLVTIDGLAGVQCDQLYIVPENVSGISTAFQLTASDVPSLTITGVTVSPLVLGVSRTGTNLTLQWYGGGVLQSTGNLAGANWTTLSTAASPYTVAIGSTNKYFRLSQPAP
jgi:hypothetical protein